MISAVLSAIAAIAEKKSLFKVNALEFSALVSVFSFIFAIPFIFFFDTWANTWQALLVLFIKCIFNAVAFYSVMEALKRLDISSSLPLMDLSPAVVAVLALIFLKEALSFWQVLGLILLVIGTYIINLREKITILEPFKLFIKSKGHNFILLALAAFTITSVLDKVLVGNIFKMAPEAFMFFQQLFTLVIFFFALVMLRRRESIKSIKESVKKAGFLIAFVGLLTIGYRYAQIVAVKSGKVALVLAVKRLSVLIACIIGGKLFQEHNLVRRISAAIIILAGIILLSIS